MRLAGKARSTVPWGGQVFRPKCFTRSAPPSGWLRRTLRRLYEPLFRHCHPASLEHPNAPPGKVPGGPPRSARLPLTGLPVGGRRRALPCHGLAGPGRPPERLLRLRRRLPRGGGEAQGRRAGCSVSRRELPARDAVRGWVSSSRPDCPGSDEPYRGLRGRRSRVAGVDQDRAAVVADRCCRDAGSPGTLLRHLFPAPYSGLIMS
jgi:hypothetical protein